MINDLEISDIPGVLSGDQIGFLDPHEAYFTNKEGKGPAKKTSSYAFKVHSDENKHLTHQFEPFKHELFGAQNIERERFDGTLFRFPLRQVHTPSELSPNLYGDSKIRELFSMFESEAHSFLLFLNNVEKIELYEKGSQHQKPRRLLTVKIADQCLQQVRAARKELKQKIKHSAKAGKWHDSSEHVSYGMTVELISHNTERDDVTVTSKHWLVTQYYAGGQGSPRLKKLVGDSNTRYLPWVGVALPLQEAGSCEPQGQVFCFLPLPATKRGATGFHFHVNGYFAVSQNRSVLTSTACLKCFSLTVT